LFHLGRHTWQCEDAAGSNILASHKIDSWGGAVGVVNDVRTQWEHRLHTIAFWHRTFATRKKILNVGECVDTQFEWGIECSRDDFASQIVGCRSKAAGRDDDIGATRSILKDIDIFDSVVKNGKLSNCNLYGTQVKNSELYDCKLVFGNKLFESKFQNSIADYGNLLENCYIDCPQQMVDCEVKGGVLRKADLGRNSLISEQTEKVKDFNEIRTSRFISDSRLKNLNDPITKIKFKNINY
jgi:hypothetical protein